jgi:hypothetical protein
MLPHQARRQEEAASGANEDVEAKSFAAKRLRYWRQGQASSQRLARQGVAFSLFMVCCIAVLYELSCTEEYARRRNEELRLARERDVHMANQVRIYISGEPTFTEHTDDSSVVDFSIYDLLLLSGGANLHPGKSFWFAELLRPFTNIFEEHRNRYQRASERTYADVMFRSSMCDKQREDLVAAVRSKVEAAGFTFKQEGKCGGTGYSARVSRAWNRQIDRWSFCEGCKHSKIVLAFERHTKVHNYLGEKLFLPLEYGAVPVYAGNGHPWMKLLGVNPNALLDRAQYESDNAFAEAVVGLLKDPQRLDTMQSQPVFRNVTLASGIVKMYVDPLKTGATSYPDLFARIQSTPKLRRLYGRKLITFSTSSGDPFNVQTIVKGLFHAKYAVRLERADEEDADIVVYRCC